MTWFSTRWLFLVALVGMLACTSGTGASGEPVSNDDDSTSQPVNFELLGSWNYTGDFAGLTNSLAITNDEMTDVGDYQGTGWEILFAIESWSNDTDQSQLRVSTVQGFSHYEVGSALFMTWQLEADSLKLYSSPEDYPEASGGAEGSEFFTYSRQR